MYLSVIIPTCNRKELLKHCLDQLQPGTQILPIDSYEVIVTDDSTDHSSRQLIMESYPWVKWIEGPKKGPAANRNNGTRFAKGDWLVFTDDDCLPDKSWLHAFREAIYQYPSVFVFEGYTNADRPKQRFDEESPINVEGGFLWSCNFMVQKESFYALGGFDEGFPYPAMEDTDFQLRVLQTQKIVFVKEAKVIHPWRRLKPFANYKKRVASHKYFSRKYNQYNTWKYRYSRLKVFVGDLYFLSKELIRFSFKGWQAYFERLWFDLLLIFS